MRNNNSTCAWRYTLYATNRISNFILILPLQKCRLFAKGLKQTETSILLGLLVLIAFCMGHATVNVHPFWSEPVIVWIISVITTGKLCYPSTLNYNNIAVFYLYHSVKHEVFRVTTGQPFKQVSHFISDNPIICLHMISHWTQIQICT